MNDGMKPGAMKSAPADAPGLAPASPFLTARQRAAERAAKREALLLAAVRAFNERGFAATSLDDVAASLGVTKPVIYHYLGNKDQVLFACLELGVSRLRAAAAEGRASGGDGLSRLRHFLIRYAETMMGDFGRCVVRAGDLGLAPDSRARFRAMKREIDQTLREMLAAAAADGSATVRDARLVSFAVTGALNWSAQWFREDGAMDKASVARGLVDVLCDGLRPRA